MIVNISLDCKLARFLSDLPTWTTAECRGFTNDGAEHDAATKMNAAAKTALLNIHTNVGFFNLKIIGFNHFWMKTDENDF